MKETTKTIFEKYEIRKSKKQKTDFINWIKSVVTRSGYNVAIENGLFGARNIIIGDPEKAKVIYTAHYDTCAALPFPNFITPKNFSLYILYQFALILFLTVLLFGFTLLLYILKVPHVNIIIDIILWVLVALMLLGPANKHTANDNTSGVTVLMDTIAAMPAEERNNAAFILFDLEEAGLLGSISYRLKHRKQMKQKILINFDCVSDGNNILVIVKRKAKHLVPVLKEAFKSNDEFTVEVRTKGVFYPSDQMNFRYGIGVAALKRTSFFKILYLNRIHTKKDVIYDEKNIAFLVNAAITLTKMI